ncbi:MAG: 1-deoxy-D-xylulose-5-phosphate synthase [Lachnospiraceae bacterium]|nr:1-deoxy-D-xylulose-5-phosphate synthase [Lachnospiraceae bacterium]MDD3615156.1 1-deoxy-D-xylulose-5-phosphate synthase [Lachnospiraceae bacterium]
MVLEKINQPNDIKDIPLEEFPQLAQEIRDFLIDKISRTGGHLASNLGVVELTMALHNVLNLPEDKIIWDVGHQAYTHKILTGRKAEFENLRKKDGLSGFPKRSESPCDTFDTGHSTTSISAGIGYVRARELKGEDYRVVSVIGDGSMTGGMAFEAFNNAAELKSNFIIVLNDNKMSISENVGGLSSYLGNLRTGAAYNGLKVNVEHTLNKIPVVGRPMANTMKKTKRSIKQLVIPGMFFEDMGITYLGPVDGHNTRQVMRLLNEAKRVEGAVLVHVVTQKGKGYIPAMRHPARFHGTAPFEIETGLPLDRNGQAGYTDIFSTVMRKTGDRREDVVAVTAAMPDGTGLKRFKNMFPKRFFDVGMAEEHAVTFAAGLALGGLTPVVAIYSSFLQRAFDQIMDDVCMQNLHVVFAIDRAGLVGSDGETHQGAFDISYMTVMPNMTVMAPKNKWELSDMLKYALDWTGPISIRYPRGTAYDGLKEHRAPIEWGKSEVLFEGEEIAVLALGNMVKIGEEIRNEYEKEGKHITLINARFAKPLDIQLLDSLKEKHSIIVTMEDNVKTGGFGEQVTAYLHQNNSLMKVINVALPDCFVQQGKIDELFSELKMDAQSVRKRIEEER